MKAIIVIDVPNITESCEIDELGLVADMHIRPTTMCRYKSFDLEEVDVRPMPEYRKVSEPYAITDDDKINMGYNECIGHIVGDCETAEK